MLSSIKALIRVARYCDSAPGPKGNKNPFWRILYFPWKCYKVYCWRKEIGIISSQDPKWSLIKGIFSYGRWLRSYDKYIENRRRI